MSTYKNPDRFKGGLGDRWQYMFLWYGGELEYKYRIGRHLDLSSSFIPGYPDLMSFAVGLSFDL